MWEISESPQKFKKTIIKDAVKGETEIEEPKHELARMNNLWHGDYKRKLTLYNSKILLKKIVSFAFRTQQ